MGPTCCAIALGVIQLPMQIPKTDAGQTGRHDVIALHVESQGIIQQYASYECPYLPKYFRHVQDGLGNSQLVYGTSSINLSKVLLLKLSKFAPGCAVSWAPF